MQMYHLGLILAALVALLVFIFRKLTQAILVNGEAGQRTIPAISRPIPAKAEVPHAQSQADIAVEAVPRIRRRTLVRKSDGGGDPGPAMNLLNSDLYTQVEKNLERAFESYATGRTTLARYRASVEAEEKAMIRHLASATIERAKPNDHADAARALEAIRWCLHWADDIEPTNHALETSLPDGNVAG